MLQELERSAAGYGRGVFGSNGPNQQQIGAARNPGARAEVKIQRSYNSYALTEATPIVAKLPFTVTAMRLVCAPNSMAE